MRNKFVELTERSEVIRGASRWPEVRRDGEQA